MRQVKRPLRNAMFMLSGDAAARLIGFVVNVYLARVLEPAGFGIITVGLAVLGFLMFAASPGIQTVEARNVAGREELDHERIGAVLSFRLILALPILAITVVMAVLLIDDPVLRQSIARYAFAVIPLALFLDWAFAGRENFRVVGLAKAVNAVVYACAVFLLVRSAADILLAPVAFAAGAAAAALLLLGVYRKRLGPILLGWNPRAWKTIAAENAPVGLAVFLGQNVTNLPAIVTGVFAGSAAAGELGAALKPVFALLALDRLINALFLPVMTRYIASARSDMPHMFAVVARTILFIILPVTVAGILAAPWLIPVLFGDGYAGAIPLFQILLPYVALTLLSSVFVIALLAAGKERVYVRVMIVSSLIIAALVFGLTILAGATGAAWAVVAGEAAATLMLAAEAKAVTGVRWRQILPGPLAAAGPMAAAFLLVPLLSPLLSAAAAVLLFVPGAVIVGTRSGDDLRLLRERFL
jgi:polysaccharide transporter, PST family